MARRKNQKTRDVKRTLKAAIAAAVGDAFPGCTAEFCGGVERSRMATTGPTLGFRIRDGRGKYRSNVIWFDPTYDGEVTASWVEHVVKRSNG
jgi:hypothetical protein